MLTDAQFIVQEWNLSDRNETPKEFVRHFGPLQVLEDNGKQQLIECPDRSKLKVGLVLVTTA